MTQAHCILFNYGYTHIHVIRNTYSSSKATTVKRTRLSVKLYVHYLSCLVPVTLRTDLSKDRKSMHSFIHSFIQYSVWRQLQSLLHNDSSTQCDLELSHSKQSFYDIMGKNIEEPDRPKITIWRMRIACWIPNAGDTHRISLIECNSGTTQKLAIWSWY